MTLLRASKTYRLRVNTSLNKLKLTDILIETMIDFKGFTIRVMYRFGDSQYLIVEALNFIAVRTFKH